jgi:adenylate cyclase
MSKTVETYFQEKFETTAKRQDKFGEKENKVSRQINWSLQLKLMMMNSLIVISTCAIIIAVATYFFKEDNEIRAKEENIRAVELYGNTVQTYMSSVIQKSKQMGVTLENNTVTSLQKKLFANLYFDSDTDIVFLGIYSSSGKELSLSNSIVNYEYIQKNKMSETFFKQLILNSEDSLKRVLNGGVVLSNINKGNDFIPYLAIAIPFTRDVFGQKVLISILKLDNILPTFEKKGISNVFLVDMAGNVLAHPEKEKVFLASNLIESPIVQEMLKSPTTNGQRRFEEEKKFYIGSFKKVDIINGAVISVLPEEKVFEEVYNIQRRNIYILSIGLFLSLIITFLFAKTISLPIISLLAATVKISKGDFKVDIKAKTRDEIGVLTDHFITMSQGLEERERVKDAFGRFVNPTVVEMILSKELKLGGDNKLCAIFFSDIRGFTSISEKLSPEEVVEFLNEYMTLMVNCIDLTYGIVDKFIGDAIMATSGAVETLGNPAENAINAAIMMRDSLIRFNRNRGSEKKPIIKIGSGMNFGPVIAGQIGSENRLEYTVIGDAVNLASRIEALNKPFGTDILISADMYEQVKDIFLVEKMKQITVKGKEEPQTIYAVITRNDDMDPNSPKSLKELRELLGIKFDEKKFVTSGEEEEQKYSFVEEKSKKENHE